LSTHIPRQGIVEDALCDGQNYGAAEVLHEYQDSGTFGDACFGKRGLNRDERLLQAL
jgi:hypothetical protein